MAPQHRGFEIDPENFHDDVDLTPFLYAILAVVMIMILITILGLSGVI